MTPGAELQVDGAEGAVILDAGAGGCLAEDGGWCQGPVRID